MGRPPRPEPDDRASFPVRIDRDLLDRFQIALRQRKPRRTMTGFVVEAITKFVRDVENG